MEYTVVENVHCHGEFFVLKPGTDLIESIHPTRFAAEQAAQSLQADVIEPKESVETQEENIPFA